METMKETWTYLSILNPEQLEAVCHTGSPLLILAGAGSGKTRVITTKIAWLIAEQGVRPESILAVTFTNKAAREMAERAQGLDERAGRSSIRTFHSFGAWMLRRYAEWAGLSPNFTIYDDDDSVTLLMKALPQLNKQEAQRFMRKIARAKDYCLLPESPQLTMIDPAPEFAVIYRAYQQRLRETGNADFGDLIMLPVQLLHEHTAIAQQLHRRFKVILVDEYQDSNDAQFRLLRELTGENTYVCVVGDDDQSIYRFRGAEVQNILTFDRQFPHTKIIRLVRNYRSYEPILRVAGSIVSRNEGRLGKTLVAYARAAFAGSPAYIGARANAEEAVNTEPLAYTGVLVFGDSPEQDRENAQQGSDYITVLLGAGSKLSIPKKAGAALREFLTTLYSLRSLLAALSSPQTAQKARADSDETGAAASDSALDIDVQTDAVRSDTPTGREPADAAGTDTAEGNTAASGVQLVPGQGLAAFVLTVIEHTGLGIFHRNQDEVMGTQKTANLQELANTASLYPCTAAGLTSFLEHIELDRSLAETDAGSDAVQLITIHNTKGLEFPNVVITGLENGIFPRNDESAEDMEEERRLMYVACTRAKDELYMTSCAARRMYGKLSFMEPSRFLAEIDEDLVDVAGQPIADFAAPADEEAALWKCGQRIFHDDYGYGYVVQSRQSGGELVITVQFETGSQKRFFPAYQKAQLFRVD